MCFLPSSPLLLSKIASPDNLFIKVLFVIIIYLSHNQTGMKDTKTSTVDKIWSRDLDGRSGGPH